MERPGSPFALGLPVEVLDAIADRVARAVIDRLPDPPEPYFTVEQAATYLACTNRRIYDLHSQRRLRSYGDGSRLLFKRADLDSALRADESE